MARLGWDNVAAPDFSGASNGIQSAASMITQALRGAEGGVKEYNNILDGNVNKAFALELLKYQDPESYKAALAEGSIPGQDSRRLSAESIGAAGTRYNTLLGQAQTEFQMDRDKRIDGQAQAYDKNAGAIAELRRLSYTDEAAANAYAASRPDLFQGMGARDILSVIDANQSAVASGWNLKNTKQNYAQDGTEFGWRTEDRANGLIEKAAFDQLIGMDDKADQARALQGMTNLPAGSKAALWTQLGLPQGMDYSGFNAAGAIGTAATGGSGTFDTVLGNGQFGSPAKPLTTMTGAEAMAFGKEVLIPNTRNNTQLGLAGTGKGSSALGAFQIVTSTYESYAPKVIGKDWKTQPFSVENQHKVATQIYNDNRSVAGLRNQWTSLKNVPDATVAELVKAGPEAALKFIASKEAGISGNAYDQAMSNTGAAVSRQVGQSSASMETVTPSPIADIFMRNAGKSGISVRDAAKAMVADDSSLSLSKAEAAINDMMAEAAKGFGGNKKSARNINPMMAADLIRHFSQTTGSRGFWDNTVRNISSNITGGEELGKDSAGFNIFSPPENAVTFDRKSVLDQLKQYATGQMEGVIRGETERGQIGAQAKQAETALAAAQARYNTRLQRRNQGLPVSEQALASDLIAIQAAQAQLTALNGASGDTRTGAELHGRPSDAAPVVVARSRPAQQPRVVRPAAAPPAPPKKNSAEARRSRAADMLGNAAMVINPIYWAGRLIDGQ